LKILAIGNSFSSDATRYLHEISKKGASPVKVTNLMIGGCSLVYHFLNIKNNAKAYLVEENGYSTETYCSIYEAIKKEKWDYITLQQVSHLSINYNTYIPALLFLQEYIKLYAPKSKIIFHRTWAYKNDSFRLNMELGYENHKLMFEDIKKASQKAVEKAGIKNIIPAGELIAKMVVAKIPDIYRDDFHLSYGLGRYAAAALWYKYFTGDDIIKNDFNDLDEKTSKEDIIKIKKLINDLKLTSIN